MKKITPLLALSIITFALFCVFTPETTAFTLQEGAEAARCDNCPSNLFGDTGVFRQITNTILYIVGVVTVIVLIWGGLRYVLSGGDSKKVTDAKNTVLYAIIGLIISFLAFAIVNFVVDTLPSDSKSNIKKSQSNLFSSQSVCC